MKKCILVLTIFIFMMSCLAAATNTSTINRSKPMNEVINSPVNANHQTSISNPPDRETYLNMDFTGLTTIPTGWTIDTQPAHWGVNPTNNAGGTSPELRFNWSPQWTGTTRLISPNIDLTGIAAVNLSFLHMVDHYGSPYTLGIATRSHSGDWHEIWTLSPTDMVNAEAKEFRINNSDVGSSSFQFCFYFTGNTYNINYWYIDNIKLYMWAHDVKVSSIDTNITYTAGAPFVPPAIVTNTGLNTETFSVNCEITQYNTVVYSQTISMDLEPGQSGPASLPLFAPPAVNETYQMVVTTTLEGDQDVTNDTMTKYFNTFATERQKAVVEIGTGTWCQYCPGAAMGADDLVQNGKEVAVVEYHNGDTFTNSYSNARNTYYGITGFPTAVFDGTSSFVGGSHTVSNYSWYLPFYNNAISLMSPFYLALTGTFDGTALNVNATVNRYARITSDPLVLHFVVTESAIQFTWQGQTHLEFVERTMVPNENGSALNIADVNTQTIPLSTTISTAWNVPNLDLVAFVQNPATKVIYQGIVMPLIDLVDSYVASPPQNLTAIQNGSDVYMSWNSPSVNMGLSGYLIYRDDILIYTKTHTASTQYADPAIPGVHTYVVKSLFGPTTSDASNAVELTVVGNNDPISQPVISHLIGSYPNPFSQDTSIRYEMVKDAKVTLAVYNVKGQIVRTLENGLKAAGAHEITWDGKDKYGNKLASGVYIYRFTTGNVKQTQKAILLK
jgi:hypothetical protein